MIIGDAAAFCQVFNYANLKTHFYMQYFSQSLHFMERSGRITLLAKVFSQGNDMQIQLAGGKAHIGAVAIADASGQCRALQLSGHHDDIPAAAMAKKISSALGINVAVNAGIHYDNITQEEIAQVLKLSDILADRIVLYENNKKLEARMLTIKDLDEFEKYIRSGELEENFKCSPEETRYQILELLEKLMDVSELADEAATRLIFRGLPDMGTKNADDGGGNNTLQ